MRINYHPTEKLNAEIGKEGISMNYHAKRKLTRSSMYITLALAICTVSDSLVTGEATSSLERQESFTQMMELALELAVRGEGAEGAE